MKTTHSPRAVSLSSETTLFDSLLLLIAGAAFEVQTHGAVRPFGLQRRTLKALSVRGVR